MANTVHNQLFSQPSTVCHGKHVKLGIISIQKQIKNAKVKGQGKLKAHHF